MAVPGPPVSRREAFFGLLGVLYRNEMWDWNRSPNYCPALFLWGGSTEGLVPLVSGGIGGGSGCAVVGNDAPGARAPSGHLATIRGVIKKMATGAQPRTVQNHHECIVEYSPINIRLMFWTDRD